MRRMIGQRQGFARVAVLAMVVALLLAVLPTAAFAAPSGVQVEAPVAHGSWYTVKAGDTLSHIARYYGTTVQAIKNANNLTSSVIWVGQRLWIPAATVAASCTSTHTVVAGDNLSRIARRYGVNVWALAAANGLTNASLIVPGQRICIPNQYAVAPAPPPVQSCWYTVQSGDNLSRIAARSGVSWPHMASRNGLTSPWTIVPGQKLWVCN